MYRALLAALIVTLCVAGGLAPWRAPPGPPQAAIESPTARIRVVRCEECHEELVASYRRAPHLDTLRPGDNSELMAIFAGREQSLLGDTFRFESRDGRLWFASRNCPTPLPVDWIFGSGHHAMTPVTMLENPDGETELIQLHVTLFANGQLGITPGSEEADGLAPSLGLHHSPARTESCLACHASHLPRRGAGIDLAQMQAGVTCARCHPGSNTHAASEGESRTAVDWTRLDALTSINRCGECHRRADEFTPDELVPDSVRLTRFAPVGLSQSRCFTATEPRSGAEDARRLDCVTCHDPHKPAETDPWFYVDRCLRCHDSTTTGAPDCAARAMTSECLSCHMPKVPSQEHLAFTDHWIRVRREADSRGR